MLIFNVQGLQVPPAGLEHLVHIPPADLVDVIEPHREIMLPHRLDSTVPGHDAVGPALGTVRNQPVVVPLPRIEDLPGILKRIEGRFPGLVAGIGLVNHLVFRFHLPGKIIELGAGRQGATADAFQIDHLRQHPDHPLHPVFHDVIGYAGSQVRGADGRQGCDMLSHPLIDNHIAGIQPPHAVGDYVHLIVPTADQDLLHFPLQVSGPLLHPGGEADAAMIDLEAVTLQIAGNSLKIMKAVKHQAVIVKR